MAPSDRDALEIVLRVTCNQLRNTGISSVQEARFAWILQPQLPNFVLAAEGAICDAALVYGIPNLPTDPTLRLDAVLAHDPAANVIIPIEFKSICGATGGWHDPTSAGYRIALSPAQRDCAAVIVINPEAPHLVAIIPRCFLDYGDNQKKVFQHKYRDVPAYTERLEPMPMEHAAFVMPVEFALPTMQAFGKFVENPDEGWTFPYNGITVRNIPAPGLHPVHLLRPHPESTLQDFDIEQEIRTAFAIHGQTCRVEKLILRPGVADFLIVHLASQERLYVELKYNMGRLDQDGTFRFPLYRRNELRPIPRVLSATTRWDYMLCILPKSDQAVFFPRDAPPADWFETYQREGSWDLDHESYVHPWHPTKKKAFVRGIERAIEQRWLSQHNLRVETAYKFVLPTATEVENAMFDKEDMKQPLSLCGQGGTDQMLSIQRLMALRERLLKQQCHQRGFGYVYRLGHHPTATHVYVPVAWNGSSPPSYFDLDPQIPVLYVNFVDVTTSDEEGISVRWRSQVLRLTHGVGASVCILFPVRDEISHSTANCYIIPSPEIDGDGRLKKTNQKHSFEKHIVRDRSFVLASGKRYSAYTCIIKNIIPRLENLCRRWLDARSDVSTQGSNLLTEAVTTRAVAMSRGLDMEVGNSPLAYTTRTIAAWMEGDKEER